MRPGTSAADTAYAGSMIGVVKTSVKVALLDAACAAAAVDMPTPVMIARSSTAYVAPSSSSSSVTEVSADEIDSHSASSGQVADERRYRYS